MENNYSETPETEINENVPLVSTETQIQIQDNLYHQVDEYQFGHSMHYCSGILNIFVWAATIFFIIAAILNFVVMKNDSLIHKVFMASYIILPVSYVIYIIESCFSSTSKYLWNLNFAEDVTTFIYRLQHIAPSIWMKCECYHYETRYRTVTKTVCIII
jgi:hypothetical protein